MSVFRARRSGAVLVFALVWATLPGVGAAQEPAEYVDNSFTVTLDGFMKLEAATWEWTQYDRFGPGDGPLAPACIVNGANRTHHECLDRFSLAGGYNNQPAAVPMPLDDLCFRDRQGAGGTGRLATVANFEHESDKEMDVTISDFGWQIGNGLRPNHWLAEVNGRWTDGEVSGRIEGVLTRSFDWFAGLWPYTCWMQVTGQLLFIPDGLPTEL